MSLNEDGLNDGEQSHDRWLVSYADFITLMFAFFVILYATSEHNAEKTKKFQESIEKYLIKAGAMGDAGARVAPGEKNFSVIEAPLPTYNPVNPDDLKAYETVENSIESQLTEAERKKYLMDLQPDDHGVRVVISGAAVYGGASAKFSAEAMKFVEHFSEILKGQNKRVMIEGHVTDGSRGEFASPWDLAGARAINWLRFLNKKYDFKTEQLAASTFGDSRPLSSKKSPTAAQNFASANDRIEFLLYYKDAEF